MKAFLLSVALSNLLLIFLLSVALTTPSEIASPNLLGEFENVGTGLRQITGVNCPRAHYPLYFNLFERHLVSFDFICTLENVRFTDGRDGTSKTEYADQVRKNFGSATIKLVEKLPNRTDLTIGFFHEPSKRLACYFPGHEQGSWRLCSRKTSRGCSRADCEYPLSEQ